MGGIEKSPTHKCSQHGLLISTVKYKKKPFIQWISAKKIHCIFFKTSKEKTINKCHLNTTMPQLDSHTQFYTGTTVVWAFTALLTSNELAGLYRLQSALLVQILMARSPIGVKGHLIIHRKQQHSSQTRVASQDATGNRNLYHCQNPLKNAGQFLTPCRLPQRLDLLWPGQ